MLPTHLRQGLPRAPVLERSTVAMARAVNTSHVTIDGYPHEPPGSGSLGTKPGICCVICRHSSGDLFQTLEGVSYAASFIRYLSAL